jgi:phage shock protein B
VHPEIIFVPVILFVLFVAPIWLWLHYREKQRQREALAGLVPGGSPELARTAQRLEDRVAALEALLDAEMPDWRKRRE